MALLYSGSMPNRLANETSPYLLQHAKNPVDWYPWGDEAFARARDQERPILLSVGYSACHWCHVMAHESFEDPETARLMNDWFVNIKVDREERPDVDSVYMTAVQAMTGQGGWPMTVFLTPDGRPFYGGTYFPPSDNHGRPGFPRVLEALHNAWTGEREQLLASADGITDHLRAAMNRTAPAIDPHSLEAVPDAAIEALRAAFDEEWGGFGQAPKFPSPSNLEFLLAHQARTGAGKGDPSALQMVLTTLVRMAQGGIYDHLGGGFARYSVDGRWLVPHFEKMLYDNAQLARLYLHAFQVTGEPFFERIVRETLGYLEREMLDPEGGFYAAQDADSDGIEGKYFVWTPAEIRAVVGADAGLVCAWHGVTEQGNFRDPHHPEFGSRNVLSTWRDPEEVATEFGLAVDEMFARIDAARAKLLAVRETRTKPGLDDKVLASWNGLALAAFADAARVLGDAHYREVAESTAAFLRGSMWRDGNLLHSYKGGVARVPGMLEDYAFVGLGLVELFKLTGDLAHLEWADGLLAVLLSEFRHGEQGFYETSGSGETLLLRPKPTFDGPTPSGNAAAGQLAWWLGRYFGRADYEAIAGQAVALAGDLMTQAPTGFGATLLLVELARAPRQELAIVGPSGARAPLEGEAARRYRPWLVIAPSTTGEGLPLFEGRETTGDALAYVCEDMTCQLPVSTPEQLAGQLDG